MDIKDITIGITKIDKNIYQLPQIQLSTILNIQLNLIKKFFL